MFVIQKGQLVAALETVAYVGETLTSTEFDIEVENLEWSEEVAEFQRKVADGTLDSFTSVMGMQSGTVTFTTPINTGATAGEEPKWGKFLEACGYIKTTYTTTGFSWAPSADATHVPMTFECFEMFSSGVSADLNKQLVTRMVGCMGNVSFAIGDVGEPIIMTFEFTGQLTSVADRVAGSLLVPTGTSTVNPAAVLDATVTVNGVAKCISTFEINSGNSVNLWKCADESSGIKGAYIGSKELTLTIDPVAELLATDPVYTDWRDGVTGIVDISLSTTIPVAFSAPVAQKSTVGRGDREESRIFEEVYRLHRTSGDTGGNDALELLVGSKT